jgi:hypothetical protein
MDGTYETHGTYEASGRDMAHSLIGLNSPTRV